MRRKGLYEGVIDYPCRYRTGGLDRKDEVMADTKYCTVGKCDFETIKAQSAFCTLLITRLHNEIEVSGEGSWSGMENHCRKQDDIKRIRRELLTLSKMLDPWGSE